jgi:transposase
MPRRMFTDDLWGKLKMMLLKMGIYDKPCLRHTIEGIFYRLRVGCPWRDLPATFGNWNAVYKRFNDWSQKEKLLGIFNALVDEPDLEWEFIDGSIVKAHQHSSGAAYGQESAIGKSVAGNTTKIHMAVDSCGLPIDFSVTGGEVHDCQEAPTLVAELPKGDYIIADKGYDREPLRTQSEAKGSAPIIPRKKNANIGNEEMDWVSTKTVISLKMSLHD